MYGVNERRKWKGEKDPTEQDGTALRGEDTANMPTTHRVNSNQIRRCFGYSFPNEPWTVPIRPPWASMALPIHSPIVLNCFTVPMTPSLIWKVLWLIAERLKKLQFLALNAQCVKLRLMKLSMPIGFLRKQFVRVMMHSRCPSGFLTDSIRWPCILFNLWWLLATSSMS